MSCKEVQLLIVSERISEPTWPQFFFSLAFLTKIVSCEQYKHIYKHHSYSLLVSVRSAQYLSQVSVHSAQYLSLYLFILLKISLTVSVLSAIIYLSLYLFILLNISLCFCSFCSLSLPVSVCSAQDLSLYLFASNS